MLPFPSISSDKVILKGGEKYSLSQPLLITNRTGLVIESDDPANPATISCKVAGKWEAVTFGKGTLNCAIRNVTLDTTGDMRGVAIYDGARHIVAEGVTGTVKGGCVVILRNAVDAVIKGFDQKVTTKNGYLYAADSRFAIEQGRTVGDLYENEIRAHGSIVTASRLSIFGLADENDSTGNKDNALRIHDCPYSTIDKSIFTGNIRLGVMGDDDGGRVQLKRSNDLKLSRLERARNLKEWDRMMRLTAERITFAENQVAGFVRLESGLTDFTMRDTVIYYPGGGTVIRNDGAYPCGGRTRLAPSGKFINIKAFALAIPGEVKRGWKNPEDALACCEDFAKRGKFDSNSTLINNRTGFTFENVTLNGKAFK